MTCRCNGRASFLHDRQERSHAGDTRELLRLARGQEPQVEARMSAWPFVCKYIHIHSRTCEHANSRIRLMAPRATGEPQR